ncbi:hypothetical protein J6590_023655 [Homalodisca vitripennis]|nr:hypothetical protein J6590_023655 [Homalodisca vitripennis]
MARWNKSAHFLPTSVLLLEQQTGTTEFPQGSCSLSVNLNLDMDEADGQVEQICTLLANFSFPPGAADGNHRVSAGILFLIGHHQLRHGRGGLPVFLLEHQTETTEFLQGSCSLSVTLNSDIDEAVGQVEQICTLLANFSFPPGAADGNHRVSVGILFLIGHPQLRHEEPVGQGSCSLSVTLNSDIDEAVGQVEQICTLLANFSFPPGAADGNHRVSAGILFLIGHPQLRHGRGGWPGGTNLHTSCQLQFYSWSSRREPQSFRRDPVPYRSPSTWTWTRRMARWNKFSHFLPTSVLILEHQTETTEFLQGSCSLSVTFNLDMDETDGQVEQICTLLANFSFPPGAADGNHRVSAGILFLIGHPQLRHDKPVGQVEQICTILANFSFTPGAPEGNHRVSAGILFLIGHPQLGHGRGGWPGGTNLHNSCQLQFYSWSTRREPQSFRRDPVPYRSPSTWTWTRRMARWNKFAHFLPTSVLLLEHQTETTEFPQGSCSLSVTLNLDMKSRLARWNKFAQFLPTSVLLLEHQKGTTEFPQGSCSLSVTLNLDMDEADGQVEQICTLLANFSFPSGAADGNHRDFALQNFMTFFNLTTQFVCGV